VLARPGHEREQGGGTAGDGDRSDVFESFHVIQCRVANPASAQDLLKLR
jgi:hypothetical protein